MSFHRVPHLVALCGQALAAVLALAPAAHAQEAGLIAAKIVTAPFC